MKNARLQREAKKVRARKMIREMRFEPPKPFDHSPATSAAGLLAEGH
jgi:hypothetical protein